MDHPLPPCLVDAPQRRLQGLQPGHDAGQGEGRGVEAHAAQQAAQAADLDAWSRLLEQRMQEQMSALERLGRLKQFVAPPLAELVVAAGGESFLQRHQHEVTVVCCALQGFTAWVERAAPACVVEVLRDYHTVMGPVIQRFEGTLAQGAGDRLQILFNAPLPCPDPAARAVQMALAMQQQLGAHLDRWRQQQHALTLGMGIAHGEATLGLLDVAGRLDYAAIGPVTQRAARLCEAAHGGHILVCPRVAAAVDPLIHTTPAAALSQQGHPCPITAVQVLGWRTPEGALS